MGQGKSETTNASITVYPVITMGEKTHGGSKANLLGRNPKSKMIDLFSEVLPPLRTSSP